ncbi:hypothetical protein [Phormidium tenue]|jgi:hypothetical protein|uniref:Restriction endonuclease n=1 Tax=Phormidium tenue FACHB-1050 TaxID=2692857 RepID=A0ABR8C6M8_9CYAN|nr:hypothetical protein [Phormidium tenue]MBD2316443.1 hypothetical protein [Phormidium tenue FACHB-1050]
MSRPLISKKNSWNNFEKCVLEVFNIALMMLHEKPTLPIEEDSVKSVDTLNRQLDCCLPHAIMKWEKINNAEIPTTPKPNLRQQPDLNNDQVINDYERTKPDFQWELRDRSGSSDNLNSIFINYAIECKRLGKDLSSQRNLNKEYVYKGILRFTTNTHRYGQSTSSGLMIGYVQNTDLQIILNEVSNFTLSTSLPEPLLSSKGWEKGVSRLDHKLDRPDIEPTLFELRHLWIDLRHHYQQPSSSSIKKASTRKKSTAQKSKSSKSRPNKDSSVAE